MCVKKRAQQVVTRERLNRAHKRDGKLTTTFDTETETVKKSFSVQESMYCLRRAIEWRIHVGLCQATSVSQSSFITLRAKVAATK